MRLEIEMTLSTGDSYSATPFTKAELRVTGAFFEAPTIETLSHVVAVQLWRQFERKSGSEARKETGEDVKSFTPPSPVEAFSTHQADVVDAQF